jgi:hypothetical protein
MRDDRLEGVAILSRFPVAFPLPAFAFRSSDARRGVGLSSRSAYRPEGRTSTGLPLSARSSCGRGGCLLYPEDGGAPPGRGTCSAGACRSSAASPCFLANYIPSTRTPLRGISRRFRFFTRPACPSPVAPWMERAPSGFPSSFAPRRYRRRTSRARPGRLSTDPELLDHIRLILQSGNSLVSCDRRRTSDSPWRIAAPGAS